MQNEKRNLSNSAAWILKTRKFQLLVTNSKLNRNSKNL